MVTPERFAVVLPLYVGAVARGDAGLRFFGELPVGATVRATVVAQDGKQVLLHVGGRPIEGRSDLQFAPGSVIILRLVEASGERVVFRVEDWPEGQATFAPRTPDQGQARPAGALERGMGAWLQELKLSLAELVRDEAASVRAREAAAELLRALESYAVDPGREGKRVAAKIVKLLRDGGYHYEKKCRELAEAPDGPRLAPLRRDLKFQAQRLLGELDKDGADGRPGSVRRAVGAVSGLLKNIVAQQVLNLKRERLPGEGPSWYFQVPVRTPEGFVTAEVAVYRRQKGQGEESGGDWANEVVLRLQTATLGELAALVWLQEAVSVQFRVRDEEVRACVQDGLDELRRGLAAAGLAVGSVDCLCTGGSGISSSRGEFSHLDARFVGIDMRV